MAAAPRFLVGVDFSPLSRRALAFARELATRSGATITIAHVRPFSDIRAAVVLERGDLLRRAGRHLGREIHALYDQQLSALARKGEHTVLLRGAPDVALHREARRRHDLLILARRGQGMASLLPGTTALRTVAFSTVPVLVVPAGKG